VVAAAVWVLAGWGEDGPEAGVIEKRYQPGRRIGRNPDGVEERSVTFTRVKRSWLGFDEGCW